MLDFSTIWDLIDTWRLALRSDSSAQQSQLLRQLARQIAADEEGAEDVFWKRCAEIGTPLVEKCANPAKRMVSFLWRGGRDTRNVGLVGGFGSDFDVVPMRRLGKSNVWYLTYIVPFDSITSYRFAPNDSFQKRDDVVDWDRRTERWCGDPLNPATENFAEEIGGRVELVRELSLCSLAQTDRPRTETTGEDRLHRVKSSILANERIVWTYLSGDVRSKVPTFVFLDGWYYRNPLCAMNVIDELVSERLAPGIKAVFVDALSPTARARELGCSKEFTSFLGEELLPWLRSLSGEPASATETVLIGMSLGGLAALYAGLCMPDRISTVVSQSGWFQWDGGELHGGEWLLRNLPSGCVSELRVRLEVGSFETSASPGGAASTLIANTRLAAALADRCDVSLVVSNGNHDHWSWRSQLTTSLRWALGSPRVSH